MSDTAVQNHAEAGAHEGLGHVVPLWCLASVFLALVLLTAVTVGVAQVDLGSWNLYVALIVAGVKASLVVLYFMHLRWDRPFHLMVFLGCLAFVVLFISLTMSDSANYQHAISPGEAPAMKDAHVPFGTPKP